MSGHVPHVDYPDAVLWQPLDDPMAQVMAHRPGQGDDLPEFPIVLRLGRDKTRIFRLSMEESAGLADALVQAVHVASGRPDSLPSVELPVARTARDEARNV